MIRIRLQKGLCEKDLLETYGFTKITEPNGRQYYSKHIGQHEIQIKLSFPENLRIQNWPDDRAPWILFKFLLDLEAGREMNSRVCIQDSGYQRIMKTQDTLDLIRDLSLYTDLKHRLQYWYKQFMLGKLKDL